MNIALNPEQQKWLEAQVANGEFASLEDAIVLAVAGLMIGSDDDELVWAKPLVEAAHASIARGEGLPASVVKAELVEQLRKLSAR